MGIPKNYRQRLVEAHRECSNIIENSRVRWKFEYKQEPLKTALLVEEHRWFWKPASVRFVFVAESHVYTGGNEIDVKIDRAKLPEGIPTSIPLNFVKLLYCLGYGNPEILTEPQRIRSNPGTSQYTNLFAKLTGLGKKPRRMTRLEWKIEVLKAARKRGIWLLDASVHACYFGKGRRMPRKLVKRIVPVSWRKYVKPILDGLSVDRKHIWIVGKTLHGILAPQSQNVGWIYQPNARFRNPKYYEKKQARENMVVGIVQGMPIDQPIALKMDRTERVVNNIIGKKLTNLGFQRVRRNTYGKGGNIVHTVHSSDFGKDYIRIKWRDEWKDDHAVIYNYAGAGGPVCIVPVRTLFASEFVRKKRQEESYENSGFWWTQRFPLNHELGTLVLSYRERWDLLLG